MAFISLELLERFSDGFARKVDSLFIRKTRKINNKNLSEDIILSAKDVGADSSGTAETKVSEHNSSEKAHADIRNLVTTLTTRLNTLADSDDTTLDQLSEIVAYIKSNRGLIENVTTNKVNVTDIIDNLTSSATNKPLAAKQGKVLKDLITTLASIVDGKANKTGDEFTGDVTFNNYIKIKALPGYGTGSANMWFNANTKTIDFNSDVLNIDLNASSVNGMHAWDFVPIYSKDKL